MATQKTNFRIAFATAIVVLLLQSAVAFQAPSQGANLRRGHKAVSSPRCLPLVSLPHAIPLASNSFSTPKIQYLIESPRQIGYLGLRASAYEGSWGGDLSKEAAAAAAVVQSASNLCLKLATEMRTAGDSLGKAMSQDDVEQGISVIKEGDSTPVTAADFAIQVKRLVEVHWCEE